MLVASGGLLDHGVKGDLVLSSLNVGRDVYLSERGVTEVAAISLVEGLAVDSDLEDIGSFGRKVDLGGHGINGEAVHLLKRNSALRSVDSRENI